MSSSAMPIAVIGVGEFGQKCLEALDGLDGYRLVAIGDRNATLAEQTARRLGVPSFVDHRRLVSQAKPQVLLVATPPPAAADIVRLAAKSGLHVIKPAPLARTLEEGVSLVLAMEQAQCALAILSPRRFNPSYRHLILQRESLGPVFLGRAQYVLNWHRQFGWRGDQATAGGGVLLEAGYEMLDLLIWAMGLPEDVYAVTGRQGRPHMDLDGPEAQSLGIYDTDDTAVVALRCTNGSAGSVVTSWVATPTEERLSLHGQRGALLANPTECTRLDADGQLVARFDGQDRPAPAIARNSGNWRRASPARPADTKAPPASTC